jgi:hypothetical protein
LDLAESRKVSDLLGFIFSFGEIDLAGIEGCISLIKQLPPLAFLKELIRDIFSKKQVLDESFHVEEILSLLSECASADQTIFISRLDLLLSLEDGTLSEEEIEDLKRILPRCIATSLEVREKLFNVTQKLLELDEASHLRKQLLPLLQEHTLGIIQTESEINEQSIELHFEDVQGSEYLQNALFSSFVEGKTGVIEMKAEDFAPMKHYFDVRKNLKELELNDLTNYYACASYLINSEDEATILALIEQKISSMSLDEAILFFKESSEWNCSASLFSVISDRIFSFTPDNLDEIISFYLRIKKSLGEATNYITSSTLNQYCISRDILDCLVECFPNIETLCMSNCDINAEKMGDIIPCLESLKYLTSLNVSNNYLGATGAQYLQSLSSLHTLDIRANQLGPTGAQHLQPLTNLHTLNIRNNNLGPTGAQYLQPLSGLHTLDIGMNELGPGGAQHLLLLTNLHTLNISGNNLGPGGAQYLQSLKNLHTLNISGNNIGADGAQYLQSLKNLHTLNISGNNLGPAGARFLQALKENLHTLDISHNNLGHDGVQHLQLLKNLHTLNISGNNLGPGGGQFFQSLDISWIEIGPNGAQFLRSWDISWNELGPIEAQYFQHIRHLRI